MSSTPQYRIEQCTSEAMHDELGNLAELLHACVKAGAGISFIEPFRASDSSAFWYNKVLPGVQKATRVLLVARVGNRIAGSVQLDCDTPPNQAHRAEVCKLIVHPDFRRLGIARGLMMELENHARQRHRTLLTLDTRTGDKAEPLYLSLGYIKVGVIPHFAKDVIEDRFDSTTIMYKLLNQALQ